MTNDHFCEFCEELENFSSSRVGKIYTGKIKNRIIRQTPHFFVVPTIGQIVPGSLLILPKNHFETYASVPQIYLGEFQDLVKNLGNFVTNNRYILWEHGAKKHTGSSCGVYHAHIHFVPMSHKIDVEDLMGKAVTPGRSIELALCSLKEVDNYIFLSNTDGNVYYKVADRNDCHQFKSQYFRKWLNGISGSTKEWDWRKYDFEEAELLDALLLL